MTTNQTIDGWAWLRRLFWNPPIEHAPEATKESDVGFRINTCGYRLEPGCYGVRFVADPSKFCGEPTCSVCKGVGPMTPERASQINQRFLQERGYE